VCVGLCVLASALVAHWMGMSIEGIAQRLV
jgi:hypothetical protein